ncbi:unnamed protein product [Urochloa humidicola]
MESCGSDSNRLFPDGLPLIWCTECGNRKIMKRASKQEWSMGQIFYCCPNYKRDGTGCPFWFWEEEYVKVLQKNGVAIPAQVSDLRMPVAIPRHEVLFQGMKVLNKGGRKELCLLALCR